MLTKHLRYKTMKIVAAAGRGLVDELDTGRRHADLRIGDTSMHCNRQR